MNKLVQYLKESRSELGKVAWPTRLQIRNNTVLVIIISLAVAIFLGLVDYLVSTVLQGLI